MLDGEMIISRPRIAQAIVFRRTAFAMTKGFPDFDRLHDGQ